MAKKHSVYIIAEAGVNHNGSVEMAKQLIEIAANAGADAVKFQTFKAEKLASVDAPKAAYQQETTDCAESQLDMLKKLELPKEAYPQLIELCKERNIDFLSTPFEEDSLHFLVDECQLPCLKIPSGEITNAPFLLEIAHTQKPAILSTGMSTLGEIEAALGVLAFGYLNDKEPISRQDFSEVFSSEMGQQVLREKVSLLHCTTEYPAPFDEVNLRAMDTMRSAFSLPVGYSDHTNGIAISLAAVARGAVIIEKHFTMDRSLAGPDHKASLEPYELQTMVRGIREIEQAIGTGAKTVSTSEWKNRIAARKSIVACKNIKIGQKFSRENMMAKRPGDGYSPMEYWNLYGKTAMKDYEENEQV